jgi:hypothetical protein
MSIVLLREEVKMPRQNAQVETRMVAEYLVQTYPKYVTLRAVPLGKVDEKLQATVGYSKALGMSRPYRPEVDAIAILPGALVLIEAKVWNVVNGLAKLPLYKSLIPVTPELVQYKSLPVVMELVVGWTNDNLEIMARDQDIRVRVFSPPWLQDVVDKLHNYWTAEYQAQRQAKLDMRKTLGLE